MYTAISFSRAECQKESVVFYTGPVAERRCKDIAAVQRMKNRMRIKIGVKANNQAHFRPQVVF